jgi:hypothetical protein
LAGEKAEYGRSIIEKLANMLTENYGRGFSQRNIFRIHDQSTSVKIHF